MLIHRSQFLIFFILGSFISSCYFEDEVENFVDVDVRPNTEYMPILSYSYDGGRYYPIQDTIWLMNSDKYFVKIESKSIYGYEVTIDGDSVNAETRSGSSVSQVFRIEGTSLAEGYHTIKITGIVKSGTGSLADVVGAEATGYSYDFNLLVSNQEYVPEITSITLTNDGLKMEWSEYPRSDFANYIVKKSEDFYFYHGDVFTETISNKETTYFFDPTFLGKKTYYRISVDRGGSSFTSILYSFEQTYDPNFYMMPTSTGKVKLAWEEPLFKKNIDSYSLRYSVGNSSITIMDNISSSVNSIEFDSDLVIGEQYPYTLSITSIAGSDGNQNHVSYRDDIAFGNRLPELESAVYLPTLNQYFIYSNTGYAPDPDGIYKFDGDFKSIDTLRTGTGFGRSSGVNKLLRTANDQRLFRVYYSDISEIDISNMSTIKSHYLGRYYYWTNKESYSISNNGRFLNFQWNESNNLQVFDFDNNQVIFSTKYVWEDPAHISWDGNYLALVSGLYKFTGTTYSFDKTIPYDDFILFKFFEDNASLLIANPTNVIIYNFKTEEEIAKFEIETPESAEPSFDELSGVYWFRNGNTISMLDVNTGAVEAFDISSRQAYYFTNDYLFSSGGFAYPIK